MPFKLYLKILVQVDQLPLLSFETIFKIFYMFNYLIQKHMGLFLIVFWFCQRNSIVFVVF